MKLKGKVLSAFIAVTMAVTSFGGTLPGFIPEVGQSVQVNAASNDKSGTCGENVTWKLDSEGTLTISGSGDMDNYELSTLNGSPFLECTDIKKVIISNGVTSIGKEAFYGCSRLTSVMMSDSITKIRSGAFQNCTSLTDIKLSNSLTAIEGGDDFYFINGVFSGCTALEHVVIPDSVIAIGERAFNNCSSLKEITIPRSVMDMTGGYSPFTGCISLAVITVLNPEIKLSLGTFGTSSDDPDVERPVELLIRSYTNSNAQALAERWNIKFEAIDDKPVETAPVGDANGDNTLNVRDAAFIANKLAQGKADELPESADFNGDGKINVRDAAAIAKFLATGKK